MGRKHCDFQRHCFLHGLQGQAGRNSATFGRQRYRARVTRVVNAADATIKGLEFELMWLAAEGLTIRANLGLLDAEYDNFLVNTGTNDDPIITDFSDLDFRRAPNTTFSLVGTYEWDVGTGMMMVQAGWRYLGSHEVDFANKPELHNSSQNLIDASINYFYNDWSFSLFGRNLGNEDGYQIGFDVAGLWSYSAPRASTHLWCGRPVSDSDIDRPCLARFCTGVDFAGAELSVAAFN